uniref:Uncharacterized protein n=1 Tax=Oryza nivara TaxID=4536 RepID=A0A0E0HCG5_ORYNI
MERESGTADGEKKSDGEVEGELCQQWGWGKGEGEQRWRCGGGGAVPTVGRFTKIYSHFKALHKYILPPYRRAGVDKSSYSRTIYAT